MQHFDKVAWFKGANAHITTIPPIATVLHGGVNGEMHCLGSFVTNHAWQEQYASLRRMAGLIDRLFPSRICNCDPMYQVIHFNNSPETTYEEVTKLIRSFYEEEEAANAQS